MEKIFLGNFNLYQIVFLLFIYSFLGWCLEVMFATLKNGKFVNRGFLNGPVCPIYGFGLIIVLLSLQFVLDNIILLFVASIILTSLLEFLTGFILEKFLHKKWWDYSKEPFNIKGYICLRFSLAWGFASVFVLKIINPFILMLVNFLNLTVGYILLAVFSVCILVDFIFTILQLTKICKNIKEIESINNNLKFGSNKIGEKLSSGTIKLQSSLENLTAKVKNSRLGKAYPNLSSNFQSFKVTIKNKYYGKKLQNLKKQLNQLDIKNDEKVESN